MPIPIVIAAVAAGIAGAGAGAAGGIDIKKARNKEKAAKELHAENEVRFTQAAESANKAMDALGNLELKTLGDFDDFSSIVSKIQNAPEFASFDATDVGLPVFNGEGIREVSVVAKTTLGGLAGAAAGTAGGFAAVGAATTIVTVLGTASTGTAISTLSGVAAYNAALAALGGGAIAAGGGGMAAGAAVLGGAAAGAALLVGGVVVNIVGRGLAKSAAELERQVAEESESVVRACILLDDISNSAWSYQAIIEATRHEYVRHVGKVSFIVNELGKTNWNEFNESEKKAFENTVLLVGLLFKLCRTNLVIDDDGDGVTDRVNHRGIKESSKASTMLLEHVSAAA